MSNSIHTNILHYLVSKPPFNINCDKHFHTMYSPSTSQPFNDGLDPEVVRILQSRDDKLICVACGTQFAETDRAKLTNCHICDDRKSSLPQILHVFVVPACPFRIYQAGHICSDLHRPCSHMQFSEESWRNRWRPRG